MAAAKRVKMDGAKNDLLERIKKDDKFKSVHGQLDQLLDPSLFVGRCVEQVTEFLENEIQPILSKNYDILNQSAASDAIEV